MVLLSVVIIYYVYSVDCFGQTITCQFALIMLHSGQRSSRSEVFPLLKYVIIFRYVEILDQLSPD